MGIAYFIHTHTHTNVDTITIPTYACIYYICIHYLRKVDKVTINSNYILEGNRVARGKMGSVTDKKLLTFILETLSFVLCTCNIY